MRFYTKQCREKNRIFSKTWEQKIRWNPRIIGNRVQSTKTMFRREYSSIICDYNYSNGILAKDLCLYYIFENIFSKNKWFIISDAISKQISFAIRFRFHLLHDLFILIEDQEISDSQIGIQIDGKVCAKHSFHRIDQSCGSALPHNCYVYGSMDSKQNILSLILFISLSSE